MDRLISSVLFYWHAPHKSQSYLSPDTPWLFFIRLKGSTCAFFMPLRSISLLILKYRLFSNCLKFFYISIKVKYF